MKRIFGNAYIGKLPEGCRLCMRGAKLVLFVTGVCSGECFYCPLSEKRKNIDVSWANERPVKTPGDVLHEARRMNAEGAGITGGDPDKRRRRTLSYIRLLKEEFGKKFHIHMYTSNEIAKSGMRRLAAEGLDEIRFHVTSKKNVWNSIEDALDSGIETGIEIPAIPSGRRKSGGLADAIPSGESWIIETAERLKSIGGDFLNINELEVSETNLGEFRKRGYETKSELSYGIRGSEETALKVLKACSRLGLSMHYCSSGYKDSVQLRKRLIRTARNTAKAYEIVSKDGLLIKGVILSERVAVEDMKRRRKELIEKFRIPEKLIAVDMEKHRIETSPQIAEELAKFYRGSGLRYALVEEYPTADRLETEAVPL